MSSFLTSTLLMLIVYASFFKTSGSFSTRFYKYLCNKLSIPLLAIGNIYISINATISGYRYLKPQTTESSFYP